MVDDRTLRSGLAPGGRSNLWRILGSRTARVVTHTKYLWRNRFDFAFEFHGNQTRLPEGLRGAVRSLGVPRSADRVARTQRFFSRGHGVFEPLLGWVRSGKGRGLPPFLQHRTSAAAPIIFPGPRGGGQNSGAFRSRTGGLPSHAFPQNSENFFRPFQSSMESFARACPGGRSKLRSLSIADRRDGERFPPAGIGEDFFGKASAPPP